MYRHYDQFCSKTSCFWNRKCVTQCLVSPVCIKHVSLFPDRLNKHEIHFPSGIKDVNLLSHKWQRHAGRSVLCIQRCSEELLRVPSTSFWASGLNRLSHTGSPPLQKAEPNVTSEMLSSVSADAFFEKKKKKLLRDFFFSTWQHGFYVSIFVHIGSNHFTWVIILAQCGHFLKTALKTGTFTVSLSVTICIQFTLI